MIQLFLDGMPAIPAANASIKLTSENPLYSSSTSYTFDVELPLDIAENRVVFGNIQRLDVSKKEMSMEARLLVDNFVALSGQAHLSTVSETSVKVQLLGGSAAYNYRYKLEKQYIDELPLGDWETEAWDFAPWKPGSSVSGSRGEEDTSRPPTSGKGGLKGSTKNLANILARNASGEVSDRTLLENIKKAPCWVAYPVMNLTAKERCNKHGWLFDPNDKQAYRSFREERYPQVSGGNRASTIPSLAVQPFIWVMAEKIAAATGANLPRENNVFYTDAGFLRQLFIVNANNFVDCRMCLPHWTVNEWWTKLEQAFGVVVSFDTRSGEMWIRSRTEHFSSTEMVVLDEVADEFKTEIDSEGTDDISTSNVGFSDFDGDNAGLLSDKQRQAARVNDDFANLAELLAYGKRIGAEALRLQKDVLFLCADGRRYIFTEAFGFMEVDQFRPRIVNPDEDVEIELDFVPAKYVTDKAEVYVISRRDGGYLTETVIGSHEARVLAVPDVDELRWYAGDRGQEIDLEKLINDEEDPEIPEHKNNRSLCYIALAPNDGDEEAFTLKYSYGSDSYEDKQATHPVGVLRLYGTAGLGDDAPTDRYTPDGVRPREISKVSLSLNPIDGVRTLASAAVGGDAVRINATVRHCFRFVADRIPDPRSLFLIRNRRFVCDKLEAQITADGLNPLLTGYFYELDA